MGMQPVCQAAGGGTGGHNVKAQPFDLVEKMGKPVIDQIPLCALDYKPPEASATPKAST
jgi:hypothetical protein